MEKQQELISVLNDLIHINKDRTVGYENAIKDSKNIDVDLSAIFSQMADQSRKNETSLTQEVTLLGGEVHNNTSMLGKVHRVWMDLKSAITGKDRESILGSCEFGEDVAQRSYETALESNAYMSTEVRQLITTQKSDLKTSHDVIKKYRELHEKVS